jgi:hypothetical protein
VRGLRIAISNPVPFSPETTGDVFCFFLPCLHLVSTANTKCKRPLWSGHGAATADGVQSLSPLRVIPFFLSSKPERAAPDDAMVRRPSIIYASHNFHARRHGTSLFPLARQCPCRFARDPDTLPGVTRLPTAAVRRLFLKTSFFGA